MARCYGCGRSPGACWTMPCLVLECALARGDRALRAWARRCGVRLERKLAKEAT